MSNFVNDRNKKCTNGISRNLEKLPDYCLDFILGIENNTSSLTRLNYSQDLVIFFDYLSNNVFSKPAKDITFADLDTLKARNFEQYLSYLSYYEYNNKQYSNGEKGKARKLATVRTFFKYNFKRDNIKSDVTSKIEKVKQYGNIFSKFRRFIYELKEKYYLNYSLRFIFLFSSL